MPGTFFFFCLFKRKWMFVTAQAPAVTNVIQTGKDSHKSLSSKRKAIHGRAFKRHNYAFGKDMVPVPVKALHTPWCVGKKRAYFYMFYCETVKGSSLLRTKLANTETQTQSSFSFTETMKLKQPKPCHCLFWVLILWFHTDAQLVFVLLRVQLKLIVKYKQWWCHLLLSNTAHRGGGGQQVLPRLVMQLGSWWLSAQDFL